MGLIRPDRGEIRINGHDIRKNRSQALASVGAIVEAPSLYSNLTGRENLQIACQYLDKPRSRADEMLELMDLSAAADRRLGTYSLGMKQRLAIARSMIGEPDLLILDEPTNGLDPAGIVSMRKLITTFPERFGTTIMLSSHLLSEIEQTATHCALISKGTLIFQDTLAALREKSPSYFVVETSRGESAVSALTSRGHIAEAVDDEVHIRIAADEALQSDIISLLVKAGIPISQAYVKSPGLEDLFLELTGSGVGATS